MKSFVKVHKVQSLFLPGTFWEGTHMLQVCSDFRLKRRLPRDWLCISFYNKTIKIRHLIATLDRFSPAHPLP